MLASSRSVYVVLQKPTTNRFMLVKVLTDAALVILAIVGLFSQSFIGLLQRPASCRFTICMCERDTERHMVPRRGGKHLEPACPAPLFFISDSFHLHQTCPDRRAGSSPPGALVKTVPSLKSSLIRVEAAGISGGWWSLPLDPHQRQKQCSVPHTCQLEKQPIMYSTYGSVHS